MGWHFDLADIRRPLGKLIPQSLSKPKLPLWVRIGMTKRRRGHLGSKLFMKQKTGGSYGNIFNKIAANEQKFENLKAEALETINKRREKRAEDKDKDFKPKTRSLRHALLGVAAYITPSLFGGLTAGAACIAVGGPFSIGFGVQVVDATRLDVGQAVLDSIQDNNIDIRRPNRIRDAMDTPKVIRDINRNATLSVAAEAMIAAVSWYAGKELANQIDGLSEIMAKETESAAENLSHTLARAAPASAQSTLQKAMTQLSRPFVMAAKSVIPATLEKTIEVGAEAVKYSGRSISKRSTRYAMEYITKDTLPLLIAQYGEAAGRTMYHTMVENGELQECPQKGQPKPCPFHYTDENGRIYYNPEAWTGPKRKLG